jgi:competence protein ComEC
MHSWMSGLVVGIISVGWWPALPENFFTPLASLAGVLSLRLVQRGAKCFSGLLLGCALGVAHGNALLQHSLPQSCVGRALTLSGDVVSLPRRSQMPDGTPRQRFELLVRNLQPLHCAGPRRVLLSYYGPQAMVPGERWRFVVQLKKPWGLANPGSFNLQSWFAQTGIDALGTVRRDQARQIGAANSLYQSHHRARGRISERISGLPFDADVRAILQAITVADKSGLDSRLWSLLQQFGVNHLLVISGLHIGLVAAAAYMIGGSLQRLGVCMGAANRSLPGLCALLMAGGYAALAGFSLATQRALYMLIAFILADLLGRRSAASGNLLLAAVLVLGLNPLAALGSGFWLSFGAVAALLWLGQWQRGAGRVRRVAGTHMFMALLMLPLGAWWFAGGSLVAAPANLLMIPLLGVWVVPAALLASCCFLLGSSMDLLLWQVAAWPLQHILPVARWLEQLSPGWMYWHLQGGMGAVLLAICAVLLLAIPGAKRLRVLLALFPLPLVLPHNTREPLPQEHTRVTVLDVGQGTAVLLQAGNRVLLYDTGGGDPAGSNMARSVILPLLRRRGVNRLDTFIVSHPDLDHAAGVRDILRLLPAARQLYGGAQSAMPQGRSCVAGESWSWPGGQTFQVLSPAMEAALPSNNASCVLSVEIDGYRLLLTGDIEGSRERQLVRYWGEGLYSDWLLAAHHGSKTSSSQTFLKRVRPSLVVLSHGYANRFGHPHPLVMQRLQIAADTVISTAVNGALEFTVVPGQPVSMRAYRQELRRYWM